MSYHQTFASLNENHVASFDQGHLPIPPSKHAVVVTCMDARVEPTSQLGVNLGEAHVIRNAGGLAKEALRSIIISQRLLGTREVAVFHHTDCGMLTFSNAIIRDKIKSETNDSKVAELADQIDFGPFPDLEQSVKDDVTFLKENPLLLEGTVVTGWTYDVKTGKVKQIA